MASCHICRLPSASSAATRWSSSPRLAPPVVTITSNARAASASRAFTASQIVGKHAEVGRQPRRRWRSAAPASAHWHRTPVPRARRRRAPPHRRSRRWRPAAAVKQATSAKPSEASAARSCGRSTAPAASTVSPASTSSPALRTLAPRFNPAGIATSGWPLGRTGAHVLLHDDGVVPLRHDGAREDARRRPGRRACRQRDARPPPVPPRAARPGRRDRSRRPQTNSRRPPHWCAPAPAEARPRLRPGCAPPPPPARTRSMPPPAAPAPSGSPAHQRAAGASCRAQSSRRGACSAWT